MCKIMRDMCLSKIKLFRLYSKNCFMYENMEYVKYFWPEIYFSYKKI